MNVQIIKQTSVPRMPFVRTVKGHMSAAVSRDTKGMVDDALVRLSVLAYNCCIHLISTLACSRLQDSNVQRSFQKPLRKRSGGWGERRHLFCSLGLFPQRPPFLPSESLEQAISTPSLLYWHGKHHLKACTVPGNLHKLNSPKTRLP